MIKATQALEACIVEDQQGLTRFGKKKRILTTLWVNLLDLLFLRKEREDSLGISRRGDEILVREDKLLSLLKLFLLIVWFMI
jgi:hypothetical protein